MPFELLWTGLVGSLRVGALKPGDLSKEAMPPPFGSAKAFLNVLTCAAIGRLVLASFLRANQRTGCTSLSAFAGSALGAMAASMQSASGVAADEAALREALHVLSTCTPPTALSLPRLSLLYKRLAGSIPTRPAEQIDESARPQGRPVRAALLAICTGPKQDVRIPCGAAGNRWSGLVHASLQSHLADTPALREDPARGRPGSRIARYATRSAGRTYGAGVTLGSCARRAPKRGLSGILPPTTAGHAAPGSRDRAPLPQGSRREAGDSPAPGATRD